MGKIVIHGGAGDRESGKTTFLEYHEHLRVIIKKSYKYLVSTQDATKAAVYAVKLLEDDAIFNAGTGSRVQMDGEIRMSASIMNSIANKFSGVINIQNIQNPITVAHRLMSQHHSVLAGEEATFFAHKVVGEKVYNPMTDERWEEYLQHKKGLTGTVGAVVLDNNKNICAATSTGGVGYEVAGRVGDSPTVAGNFATSEVGVSCTGIGEHILNSGIAVKINTRVKDGMDMASAVEKTIAESNKLGDYIGLIAIDGAGVILSKSTICAQALYAYHDGKVSRTFYNDL